MACKVTVKAAFSRQTTHPVGNELSMTTEISIRERKDALRKQAHANRNAQENKDDLSRRIVGAFMSLPEYAVAETVMFYIDVRSEVRTRHDLEFALKSGKTIVIHGAMPKANWNCSDWIPWTSLKSDVQNP
jgi:5-formyltetrahydrofolate cyclo-ligase